MIDENDWLKETVKCLNCGEIWERELVQSNEKTICCCPNCCCEKCAKEGK